MTRKVVVGLLTDKQEFQLVQASAAREAAARAGLEVEVHFADNNAVQQIHQLFQHVHAPEAERPVAIVVETVTGEGLERVARNAVKAGIGWLLVNRTVPYIETLRAERKDLPISTVTVDQFGIGQIQARQLRALLPKGGSVLYFQGPADTSSGADRLKGVQEALKGSAIELKVLNGDWTRGERREGGQHLAAAEDQRGLQCRARSPRRTTPWRWAPGGRCAILRPEWLALPFIGNDGLPEGGQKAVDTGELTATVVTPTPAGAAVSLVARALAASASPAELKLSARSYPPEQELGKRKR